jgi:hypothetical protein
MHTTNGLLLVLRIRRRYLVQRMRPADFLPDSPLGLTIDSVNRRIARAILERPL